LLNKTAAEKENEELIFLRNEVARLKSEVVYSIPLINI